MQQKDLERILRDVMISRGLPVSALEIERTSNGWCVSMIDVADRLVAIVLPNGPPAVIRAALTGWVDATRDGGY
jgi:hypothetical protein